MRYLKFAGLLLAGILLAQNNSLTGTLTFSSPDANLGFLSLDYTNPARASAVLGGFANPAAFGRISHLEFNTGMGFTNSSTLHTEITLLDSSEYNSAVVLPIDVKTKDAGGIYGFGMGAKFALLGAGFGILKPYQFSIDLSNSTDLPVDFSNMLVDTLYIENRDSANRVTPVEMHWNAEGEALTTVEGKGGLSIKASPIFLGAGIGFGPISIGAAFKITKYSGGGEPSIVGYTNSVVNITGTSHDYGGSLNARISLQDTISTVQIISNLSGTRKAFSIGANLSLGLLKIGAYFENGFKTSISGDYTYITTSADFSTLQLQDLQIDTLHVYIQNDTLHQDTTIIGNLALTSHDTTMERYEANIELPGYTAAGLGISIGLIDAFAGGSFPQKGNLHYAYGGLFLRAPIPHFKLRGGLSVSMQYYYSKNGKLIPLSVLPFVGVGASIPLNLGSIPFGPTLGLPIILDFSAKSNVLSLTGKIIEKMVGSEGFQITNTPNPLKTLSFGVGVRIRL